MRKTWCARIILKALKAPACIFPSLSPTGNWLVGRGLYAPREFDFNEQQSLLEAARLVPKGMLCLLSALRFHELTTQNPFEIWLAIKGTSRKPQIGTLPLNVFRFSGTSFAEGIETHEIMGVRLRVYNLAKTVADCFKYATKSVSTLCSKRYATPGGRKKRPLTNFGTMPESAACRT